MRIRLSWLIRYFHESDTLSFENIMSRLTLCGLEIEGIHPLPFLESFCTIVTLSKITPVPYSDHLVEVMVTDREKKEYRVICGDSSLCVNDICVLALAGKTLPDGQKIEERVIHGIKSSGMLLSGKELGISEDDEQVYRLDENDLTFFLQKKSDLLLDVNITPNRGDCLSYQGLSREVSALLQIDTTKTFLAASSLTTDLLSKYFQETTHSIPVTITAEQACQRYCAIVIKNVKPLKSPAWLRNRLYDSGIRAINQIVDITNYVMLEFGQPLHSFDFETLSKKSIMVRFAKPEEKITIIDGKTLSLDTSDLLITDDNHPIALAGVMGGKESSVNDNTVNILLESAFFTPRFIRKTSKRYGLSSESSYRFERGADISQVKNSGVYAAFLLKQLQPDCIIESVTDCYPKIYSPAVVSLTTENISKYLGLELSHSYVKTQLARIGICEKDSQPDHYEIPAHRRFDLSRTIDLVEEIARLHGLDKLPEKNISGSLSEKHFSNESVLPMRFMKNAEQVLYHHGYYQAVNFSFTSANIIEEFGYSVEKAIQVMNPLGQEMAYMRTTLIPQLLANVIHNYKYQTEDIRLFEIGHHFGKDLLFRHYDYEALFLSGIATGRRYPLSWNVSQKDNALDFFDMKGLVEDLFHFWRIENVEYIKNEHFPFLVKDYSAEIILNGNAVGSFGEINPDLYQKAKIPQKIWAFELAILPISQNAAKPKIFEKLSKYQKVERDFSLLMDKTILAKDCVDAIYKVLSKFEYHTRQVTIFDVFSGKSLPASQKSIGIRIVFGSDIRTLTDDEIHHCCDTVYEQLHSQFGAVYRPDNL